MDTEEEYNVGKSIVKSVSNKDWDEIRHSKGIWPQDENKKDWKQFQNFSIEEIKDYMRIYNQATKHPQGTLIFYLLLLSNYHFIFSMN